MEISETWHCVGYNSFALWLIFWDFKQLIKCKFAAKFCKLSWTYCHCLGHTGCCPALHILSSFTSICAGLQIKWKWLYSWYSLIWFYELQNDKRERVVKASRDITMNSKKVIFQVHRWDRFICQSYQYKWLFGLFLFGGSRTSLKCLLSFRHIQCVPWQYVLILGIWFLELDMYDIIFIF